MSRGARQQGSLEGGERISVLAASLCVAVPVWVWGGGHPDFTWLLAATAGIAWAALMGSMIGARSFRALGKLLCDPLLWLGIAFMALLGIQWWNAWWPGQAGADWFEGAAPRQGWPAAICGDEARLAFFGFLNAWSAALLVRATLRTRRAVRLIFRILVGNAVGLAVFGFVQYFSGTDSLYWSVTRYRHFFASFYYENHAGQFFYLMFALAGGLGVHMLQRHSMSVDVRRVWRSLAVLGLLFMATLFSFGRMSIVAIVLLAAVLVFVAGRHMAQSMSPPERLRALGVFLAVGMVGLALVSGTVSRDIYRDFTKRRHGRSVVEQAYEARIWQWQAALEMTRDHPLTGVGSYGFRYYIPYYAPDDHLGNLDADTAGNVHNDALYFLCEYGIVGSVLLAGMFASLLWPLRRMGRWLEHGVVVMTPLALGLVLVHSLFDLPFRLPSILAAWSVMAAGMGRYVADQ